MCVKLSCLVLLAVVAALLNSTVAHGHSEYQQKTWSVAASRARSSELQFADRHGSSAGSGAFFARRDLQTNSASIAVDSKDGVHLAYVEYPKTAGDTDNPAFYTYCSADCANVASWRTVRFPGAVVEVQIGVTPKNQPRMLLRRVTPKGGALYSFATCDSQCTRGNSWKVADVAQSGVMGDEITLPDRPQHYFALDPLGRPRFVYADGRSDHSGMFFTYCDDDVCDRSEHWAEAQLAQNTWTDVSLAYTREGIPQFAYSKFPKGYSIEERLYYAACTETSCSTVELGGIGFNGLASFVLRLDLNDRPRIAQYRGHDGKGGGERLRYLSCNTACGNARSWVTLDIGLEQFDGQQPDLALDSRGRPRITYLQKDFAGLGIAWCDTNCTVPRGWKTRQIEASKALDRVWPLKHVTKCDGYWAGGLRSSLALDSVGNPRIAYDTEGNCEKLTGTLASNNEVFRAVRVVIP